ncbi:MAG: class I SAM-dependent methyltransferase [Desulfarculaceae bacterium]|nr:class I SAM-dependent methyltransferase [Desulfarculaceae bacterium]
MADQNSDNIFTKDFWIKKWEHDKTGPGDTRQVHKGFSTPEYWDRAARTYDKDENELFSRKIEKTIAFFKATHGPLDECTVLDIGCGTGFLARHLARNGCRVTGIDFSPKMIERARQDLPPELEARVQFHTADWHRVDLEKEGWQRGFDMAIAFMCPAVSTPDSFFKLMDASKQTCAVRGWASKRKHIILDRLWEIIMKKKLEDKPRNFLYKINLLFSIGLFPELTFDSVQWNEPVALEEELSNQLAFFRKVSNMPEKELRHTIREYLDRIAENGTIVREHKGITGTALWSIDPAAPIRQQSS